MKITVITVCRNSDATIATTMRSVAEQTYPSIEHIVVDGASIDDTLSVVKKYKIEQGAVVSASDSGMYDAMNKGLRLATGDIVGFINSDDFYSSPDALSKIADSFTDPSVDACYGDLDYVDRERTSVIVRRWRSSKFSPGLFLRGWCPAHPTFYARKHVFDRYGGFDLQYMIAADVELMARFMEVHRISTRYIPEVLVKMRMGGVTNRSWRNVIKQNREIWHALSAHNLSPSLISFVSNKILLRSKQFLLPA